MVFETINSEAVRADDSDFGSGLFKLKAVKPLTYALTNYRLSIKISSLNQKSGLWDLNPRHPTWKDGTLPTELKPRYSKKAF